MTKENFNLVEVCKAVAKGLFEQGTVIEVSYIDTTKDKIICSYLASKSDTATTEDFYLDLQSSSCTNERVCFKVEQVPIKNKHLK